MSICGRASEGVAAVRRYAAERAGVAAVHRYAAEIAGVADGVRSGDGGDG